ncbi:MAG: YncE family protein, partial [Caulobacteraceae bacterium]
LIDPVSRQVAGVINVGGRLEFAAVDGKGRLYVNVESAGQVAAVDLKSHKVLAHYAMKGCERPTGIAWVAGDRVISACGSGVAVVLDAATGRQIATLKIGGFPDAVIYDPVRARAYVPCALNGELYSIALSGPHDNAIVATTATQIGARTGTVDPKTGRIYLPTAQYVLPVPPGQRPTTKPGTFQILVVGRG